MRVMSMQEFVRANGAMAHFRRYLQSELRAISRAGGNGALSGMRNVARQLVQQSYRVPSRVDHLA